MTNFHSKRKYRIKKKRVYVPYVPTEVEKERMLLVNRLYDEYGTLDKVGSLLRLTRERVRQILQKGERYHLFNYELTRDKKFNNILLRVNKESLKDQIRNTPNKFDICSNLDIDINTFLRLIKYYNIDVEGYKQDARYRKYLTEYSEMVYTLGYHPTTTVMQQKKEWRKIWVGIDRLWGTIDRFRKEFGIEQPKHVMHPNTLIAWQKSKEKRMALKKIKVANVYKVVEQLGPVSCKKISELTGYRNQNINLYLKDMIVVNKIVKTGDGVKTKYKII